MKNIIITEGQWRKLLREDEQMKQNALRLIFSGNEQNVRLGFTLADGQGIDLSDELFPIKRFADRIGFVSRKKYPYPVDFLDQTTIRGAYGMVAELPDFIDKFKNLESIYLPHTHISELPPSMANLKKLKVFYVSHADLTTFPEVLTQIPTLERIILDGNDFFDTGIPDSIGNLTNLKSLQLAKTGINYIPESITNCPLDDLGLRGTEITTLPQSIGKMNNLATLNINFTDVKSIPESMHQMTNLQFFSAKNTYIPKEEIARLQQSLPNLQIEHSIRNK